jgi:hypothetical protein
MQFTLERHKVKLANFNCRAEKHGEEVEPAADLKIEMIAPNDVLSEFDSQLKSSLYRKPDGVGDQQELIDTPGYLPKLRFPKLGTMQWGAEYPGATFVIHLTQEVEDDVLLADCTVDKFSFDCMDGGSVALSFRVKCKPDEHSAGKLYLLSQHDVEASLFAPEPQQLQAAG